MISILEKQLSKWNEENISEKAIHIAARVWCDQDMGDVIMDKMAAMEIARIIDSLLPQKTTCRTPSSVCSRCCEYMIVDENGQNSCWVCDESSGEIDS